MILNKNNMKSQSLQNFHIYKKSISLQTFIIKVLPSLKTNREHTKTNWLEKRKNSIGVLFPRE